MKFFIYIVKALENNPVAQHAEGLANSKLALLESNPPVSKLTSPLTQGGREISSTSSISSTPCLP